ncbi:hypothetical protein IFM89_010178 [Coptis chinensis]|uniref:Uncharacterized protein n=1 Tax=Coptis chinensis TaxID=261450 RepID=A0A835M7P0_9MAGN|nr:hypothetical protein IFM89_010178 [Coptis chinensis]
MTQPVDPKTQQEAGMIALYRKTHFSEKKGWVSHEAENNYERMVELQNQPTPEDMARHPPSRKRVAGYEHPDVDQLRARAEEVESQLEELRGWKEEAQETQETHQAQIQQQQRQLDYLMEKLGGPPSMWGGYGVMVEGWVRSLGGGDGGVDMGKVGEGKCHRWWLGVLKGNSPVME